MFAIIPPSPSDPDIQFSSIVRLDLNCTANISGWKFIGANVTLDLTSNITLLDVMFITLDPVNLDLDDTLFHPYLEQIEAITRLDLNVVQNFTEQLIETEDTVDPGDSVTRLNTLEHDFAVSSVNPQYFKEFSYVGEDLVGFSVYTSPAKTTTLFDIVFTFVDSILTRKTITRISDSKVLTIDYAYSSDALISQTRSIT